jgi:hypothetical protein
MGKTPVDAEQTLYQENQICRTVVHAQARCASTLLATVSEWYRNPIDNDATPAVLMLNLSAELRNVGTAQPQIELSHLIESLKKAAGIIVDNPRGEKQELLGEIAKFLTHLAEAFAQLAQGKNLGLETEGEMLKKAVDLVEAVYIVR